MWHVFDSDAVDTATCVQMRKSKQSVFLFGLTAPFCWFCQEICSLLRCFRWRNAKSRLGDSAGQRLWFGCGNKFLLLQSICRLEGPFDPKN